MLQRLVGRAQVACAWFRSLRPSATFTVNHPHQPCRLDRIDQTSLPLDGSFSPGQLDGSGVCVNGCGASCRQLPCLPTQPTLCTPVIHFCRHIYVLDTGLRT